MRPAAAMVKRILSNEFVIGLKGSRIVRVIEVVEVRD